LTAKAWPYVTGDYIITGEIVMPSHRQNWFEGWRLFAVLTLALIVLSIWIAGMRQFEVDGMRLAIRFTARTSLLFFCLAFSAAALARLWSNAWTRWQRRNRRYLGVTFAASHAIHAVAIVCFAQMDPAGFAVETSAASYIFGGLGYAFIIAMAATSFDRSAAATARAPGASCISPAAIICGFSSWSLSASGFPTCRFTACS
jgi:sulfoxide reductase heme-binding subunit YedZ